MCSLIDLHDSTDKSSRICRVRIVSNQSQFSKSQLNAKSNDFDFFTNYLNEEIHFLGKSSDSRSFENSSTEFDDSVQSINLQQKVLFYLWESVIIRVCLKI